MSIPIEIYLITRIFVSLCNKHFFRLLQRIISYSLHNVQGFYCFRGWYSWSVYLIFKQGNEREYWRRKYSSSQLMMPTCFNSELLWLSQTRRRFKSYMMNHTFQGYIVLGHPFSPWWHDSVRDPTITKLSGFTSCGHRNLSEGKLTIYLITLWV